MVEFFVINYEVIMVFIVMGSSVDLIFKESLDKMKVNFRDVKFLFWFFIGFKGMLFSII